MFFFLGTTQWLLVELQVTVIILSFWDLTADVQKEAVFDQTQHQSHLFLPPHPKEWLVQHPLPLVFTLHDHVSQAVLKRYPSGSPAMAFITGHFFQPLWAGKGSTGVCVWVHHAWSGMHSPSLCAGLHPLLLQWLLQGHRASPLLPLGEESLHPPESLKRGC